ncbi:MAG: hypothetical protein M3162_01390 [Thermoproteota archaeon]|nr:hypothetical protein [Thermoproteota archaeon]
MSKTPGPDSPTEEADELVSHSCQTPNDIGSPSNYLESRGKVVKQIPIQDS